MTRLYQLELDQSEVNCGMSYVFHLEDGRFVIIDGGYFNDGEEDRLYAFLHSRCDGKPVIAAWFFTHAHQDHVGNFMQFVRKYSVNSEIQKLLFNFHPVDLSSASGDWREKSNDLATIKEFYTTLERYCADIEKVTLHTGYAMTLGELSIEVLYTQEDLYPESKSFNDYSTVIKTTIGGQSILWLGDISAKASEVLLKHKVNLNCEMVQVSHHGINHCDALSRVYESSGAKVALWPAADYLFVEYENEQRNIELLVRLGVREILMSGYGTVELSLPYQLGTVTKYRKALGGDHCVLPQFSSDASSADSPFRYLTPNGVESSC